MIEPAAPPAKRPRGRPRKTQPDIDPSQPLHPWASTSQLQQLSTPSTSYRPPQTAQVPQTQHGASMQPPATVPAALAPVPAASFYAHPTPPPPALGHSAVYAQAAQAPVPEPGPGYVVPVPAPLRLPLPRQNVPTRADLEFLLGGPPKVRPRDSTPNVAAVQGRAAARASVAPATDPYASGGGGDGSRRSASAAHAHYPAQTHEPIAGPSRSALPTSRAVAPSQQPNRHPAIQRTTSTPRDAQTAVFPGDQETDAWPGADDYDDGFPLGAEAVMEPEHEGSSDADNEADYAGQEDDDPNDRDFRPNGVSATKRLPRHSQVSAEGPTGATSSTPPQRGRRSLASSSTGTGKVAGSTSRLDFDAPKRRGRPRKSDYTPDVIEKMKAANEILAMAMEMPGGQDRKIRLDDIIDRKTRRALSPEMQRALMRARNTQLQKERREKLRAEAEAAAGNGSHTASRGEAKVDKTQRMDKTEILKRKRLMEKRDEEAETGSGSAIVERARGKVSEWIKSISSEAEQSVEPEEPALSGSKSKTDATHTDHLDSGSTIPVNQARVNEVPPPPRRTTRTYQRSTPASPYSDLRKRRSEQDGQAEAQGQGDVDIDPRRHADGEEEQIVEGYFSRFGTVTGKEATTSPTTLIQDPTHNGLNEKGTYPIVAIGAPGDEYYFSN